MCLILSKVIKGVELFQQNQRSECLDIYCLEILESYGMLKLLKSPKMCQILQKSQRWKGWFPIICKVCMVFVHKNIKLSVILNYLWFHCDFIVISLKMGETSKSQKLWFQNPFLKFYIYIYLTFLTEMEPEILNSNNLKIPSWFPGLWKYILNRNFQK